MTAYYGPWQGSSPRARIRFDISHSYNADATSALVSGTAYIEFETNIVDSGNSWSFSWSNGPASGSNVAYNGAGVYGLINFSGWRDTYVTNVSCTVTGLEGVGATVTYSMDYNVGLAPTTDGTYYATSITATSALAAYFVPNARGGTLIDTQAQRNTSASATGATTYQTGAWANVPMTSLTRATKYYFRVRIANSTYGWGPWGPWKSFTTLATVPGAPSAYTGAILTSTSAATNGITVADNGGSTLNNVQAQRNTSASATGATTVTRGSWGNITLPGLAHATRYYFRLRAANAIGWGPWGGWVSFVTLAEIPVMGTAYTAGSLTRNSAIISGLSVTDNGGEAPSNVRVQRNTSASATGATVVTKGSWANVTVGGLAAETKYYYRCAAYNSAGWSAYPTTWKSFTTLADAPDDMAAPTFSSVADTSMRVSWVAPAMNGATFVAYYYQISLTNTFASLVASGTTAALYVDRTGLIPGTRYYVRVRANATPNNGGYGEASQLMTGTVPNSGLRVYACIGATIYQGDLYTFVDGIRKQLTPMYAHDGVIETE